jgi:serine/threonine-protein kinase
VPAGTRLNGVYEIEHLIGGGGMGEVYKGHNIQTGDPVAVKLMLPELSGNAEAMALFRREASTLHNLYHEAIVRYFVFSVDPGLGRAYLAMEFVDGPSLSDRLTHGPLDLQSVQLLQRRLGEALDIAHRLGVVHRDISPDNVILPGGDVRRAKVIDFGIARSAAAPEGTIIGGGFAGKYGYVSPEQLGLAGGDITGKSDIYSLGLVLAEALRGKPLDMGGTQFQVIEKRRTVPDLSDIDPAIRPLIQSMLQPLPEHRPSSMAAVAVWQPAPAGGRTVIRPAPPRPVAQGAAGSPASGEPETARRGGGWAIGLAMLLLLVAGGGAGAYFAGAPVAEWIAMIPGLGERGRDETDVAIDAPPIEDDRPIEETVDADPPPLGPDVTDDGLPPLGPDAGDDTIVTVDDPPVVDTLPDDGNPDTLNGQALADWLAEQAGWAIGNDGSPDANPDDTVPDEPITVVDDPPDVIEDPDVPPLGPDVGVETPPDGNPDDVVVALNNDDLPPAQENTPPSTPRSRLVLADATAGEAYAAALPPFEDKETPRQVTLTVDGTLPEGLAFTDHGAGFGTISGVTEAEGRFAFAIVASDPDGGRASMTTEITVARAAVVEPPIAEAPSREEIASFINDYDGGDCFFLRPTEVADASASVEGFGDAIAPFEQLESDFTASNGFEPAINLRLVSPAQCAAVDLAERLGVNPVSAPIVAITAYSVGDGHPLAGTIQNANGRDVSMLLVADDGAVTRLDSFLSPTRDGASFSVPMVPDERSRGAAQLLLVIASNGPLASLAGFETGQADDVLERLGAEIAGGAPADIELVFFRFANQ